MREAHTVLEEPEERNHQELTREEIGTRLNWMFVRNLLQLGYDQNTKIGSLIRCHVRDNIFPMIDWPSTELLLEAWECWEALHCQARYDELGPKIPFPANDFDKATPEYKEWAELGELEFFLGKFCLLRCNNESESTVGLLIEVIHKDQAMILDQNSFMTVMAFSGNTAARNRGTGYETHTHYYSFQKNSQAWDDANHLFYSESGKNLFTVLETACGIEVGEIPKILENIRKRANPEPIST
jgi:hypothetical protein